MKFEMRISTPPQILEFPSSSYPLSKALTYLNLFNGTSYLTLRILSMKECVKFWVDSTAASLFQNLWLSWQIESDDKNQIILLILGRGALSYLIFVIFFTHAKFLENKIYRKTPIFLVKSVKKKTPIFCVKSVKKRQFFAWKFTPAKKNLHGRRPWRPWQISGMSLVY